MDRDVRPFFYYLKMRYTLESKTKHKHVRNAHILAQNADACRWNWENIAKKRIFYL